ncbi:hypothetical protein FA15DRAFT_665861 [Coprinopsis marcescibilis]|uniref:Superoxide dismutase [Cu-Zn] n=1 Tax=Coprinopsis marcescibilis TaxID=230819 RepID=A0A5C3L7P0_COPMA|nr:hypothetical protein FA15DRAFT_665861 [Coprinopsis marcescibilis]
MDSYHHGLKPKSQKPIILGVLTLLAVLFVGYALLARGDSAPLVTKAIVVLKSDGGITGTVVFEQSSNKTPVKVTGTLKGLDPNSLRGFHVHETGDLSDGCISAGAHFNPFGKNHGAPSDLNRHVGDLGNVKTNEAGEANFSFDDSLISLNGPLSIVGRSIVLHTGTDDLGRGDNQESLKTGNAGGRAACGIIGLSKS